MRKIVITLARPEPDLGLLEMVRALFPDSDVWAVFPSPDGVKTVSLDRSSRLAGPNVPERVETRSEFLFGVKRLS